MEEEAPAPEPESEEMKQLRDMIQVAMGAELKQVRVRKLLPLTLVTMNLITNLLLKLRWKMIFKYS